MSADHAHVSQKDSSLSSPAATLRVFLFGRVRREIGRFIMSTPGVEIGPLRQTLWVSVVVIANSQSKAEGRNSTDRIGISRDPNVHPDNIWSEVRRRRA